MKYIVATFFLLLSGFAFAQNFTAYKNHIAADRIIVMFNKDVAVQRQDELIQSTGLVSVFTHIPAPALVICMTSDPEAAKKLFAAMAEVHFVSFFITAGNHYAGVLDEFFVKIKDKNMEPLLRERLMYGGFADFAADKYIPNLYKVRITANALINTVAVCEEFSKYGWCAYAAPNYLFNPLVQSVDPLYNRQWNIKNVANILQGNGVAGADMDVDTAWAITTGDENIKVAILDSGVDTLQQDLVDNMLQGHDAVSDSTDGFPTPNYKEDGHGTCCAGIVAAVKDNNKGIAGIAPTCKIIPVRAFYYILPNGGTATIPFSTAAFFADAIGWSWNVAHADIMSNSWGLPVILLGVLAGGVQPVEDAIQQAYINGRGGKGTPQFFSSGNEEDGTGVIWPANLPQTIAVTATTMCDERKNPNDCSSENWGANYGTGVDFGAPGVKITTTDMTGANGFVAGDYYFLFNGTSAACPNAAGVAALLLSVRDNLGAEEVRNIIARTCDKVGGYAYDSMYVNGSWSRELGYGRVNAYNALIYALSNTSVNEAGGQPQVKVFPNPANGVLNIESEKGTVKIFSATGQQVYGGLLQKGLNRVDVQLLAAGIYLVQINTAEGNVTRKITMLR